ncbi:MAG: DUF3616 domain-containing protein [Acidobacteria bacterium]|nr:DUF3616 domain-containing protein [Acidobacteriota bacterium]
MRVTRALVRPISASPFDDAKVAEPPNASEVVALGDGRFLFCDNNVSDTLFEMRLNRRGLLHGRLLRHTISGVSPQFYDDFEGMALAADESRRYLVLATSFSLKVKRRRAALKSRRGRRAIERESLLRVTLGTGRDHQAEIIPGFRSWLYEHTPDLGKRWRKSQMRIPDDGGLNVEGLAWNPKTNELLFGIRTPVIDGRPVVLRVRVGRIGGPWNLSRFEMLPPVLLDLESHDRGERGIRTLEYDAAHDRVLIVTGNARSGDKVPFELCAWDGSPTGRLTRFPGVRFDPRFRVEGVTPGTIGGREAMVFVDDRGGYQVLWGDDPRLHHPERTPSRRSAARSNASARGHAV